MPFPLTTVARAKEISAREEGTITKADGTKAHVVSWDGQSCMALVPTWTDYGRRLIDGTILEEGKLYRVTIEEIPSGGEGEAIIKEASKIGG